MMFLAHRYIPSTGQYQREELPGPPDFDHWLKCWNVLKTALLLLEQVDPEPLDLYSQFIDRLASMYGALCWWIVYQADVTMRQDEFERIHRHFVLAIAQGDTFLWESQTTK